jgi:predicted secreted acid phosphatase
MRFLGAFLLAVAFAAGAVPAGAAEPANLGPLKAQITTYYSSGAWEHDVAAVDGAAERYIDTRVRSRVHRPAIVLDIDDTALSDYAYEKMHDYGYDPKSYDADLVAGKFSVIAPTLSVVRDAAAHGVAVFFITGRRERLRAATLANLRSVGYPTPAGLVLRPPSDHAKSVIPFKSGARRAIAARGYTILAAFGDQYSDLRGGYAEKTYKLPNPMYFIP